MSLGGWCAEDSDNDPYLQVDLEDTTVVTSVATQGLPGHANLALKYKLNYSCDGIHWFEYEQGKVLTLEFWQFVLRLAVNNFRHDKWDTKATKWTT